MRPRRAIALAAAVALAGATAAAASLKVASTSLGAGSAGVLPCDQAFTLAYTTTGGLVSTVTVKDIADPACEGGQLSVTITGGGTRLGTGGPATIPSDADEADQAVTVTLDAKPPAADVDAYRIVIVGP